MKRFKFSMATVLEVKRRREESLKKALSFLAARKAEFQRQLASLAAAKDESAAFQKGQRAGKALGVVEESWYAARQAGLVGNMERTRRQLAEAEALWEAKRLEVVEASKERRVFERLEENQRKDYLVELNREEQAFMDELSQHQVASR